MTDGMWIGLGCAVGLGGGIAAAGWFFGLAIRKMQATPPEAPLPEAAPRSAAVLQMPALGAARAYPRPPRMTEGSPEEHEWLAYQEIVENPERFSPEEREEAEAYFAYLAV